MARQMRERRNARDVASEPSRKKPIAPMIEQDEQPELPTPEPQPYAVRYALCPNARKGSSDNSTSFAVNVRSGSKMLAAIRVI